MSLQVTPFNTIQEWFRRRKKPTQGQFWNTFFSFRHKSDKIAMNDLDDELQGAINDSSGGGSLASVLAAGNETGEHDIQLTEGDRLVVGINRAGVGKGSFETGRGDDQGVSMHSAAGFELNYQAGYLRNFPENDPENIQPLYVDSELIYSGDAPSEPSDGRSLVDKNYVNTRYVNRIAGTADGGPPISGSLMLRQDNEPNRPFTDIEAGSILIGNGTVEQNTCYTGSGLYCSDTAYFIQTKPKEEGGRGLTASEDFSSVVQDNDYVQKIFVTTAITEAIGGGGSGGSTPSLNQVLSQGNETLEHDIILTEGDRLVVGGNRAGVGKGSFDTSRGGDGGVSMHCAVGFELNYQAGYLRNFPENDPENIQPLYVDSELIYSGDAPSEFSDGRSLVDKNYVDNAIAGASGSSNTTGKMRYIPVNTNHSSSSNAYTIPILTVNTGKSVKVTVFFEVTIIEGAFAMESLYFTTSFQGQMDCIVINTANGFYSKRIIRSSFSTYAEPGTGRVFDQLFTPYGIESCVMSGLSGSSSYNLQLRITENEVGSSNNVKIIGYTLVEI
jgi:hypothetical protein